jgi:hypothetical protein
LSETPFFLQSVSGRVGPKQTEIALKPGMWEKSGALIRRAAKMGRVRQTPAKKIEEIDLEQRGCMVGLFTVLAFAAGAILADLYGRCGWQLFC